MLWIRRVGCFAIGIDLDGRLEDIEALLLLDQIMYREPLSSEVFRFGWHFANRSE